VAPDVVERALGGDVLGLAADHEAELDLVVELLAALWPDDRRGRVDDGVRELGEERRFLRNRALRLLGVVDVIEADADELLGVMDRRVEMSLGGGVRDPLELARLHGTLHRVERVLGCHARPEELSGAGREERMSELARAHDAAASKVAMVRLAQAADAVADEGAEAGGRAARGVANQLHRTLLVTGDKIG